MMMKCRACLGSGNGNGGGSLWQDVAGLLAFSAAPFTIVKLVANSRLSALLQQRMRNTKSLALKNSPSRIAALRRARKQSKWYGEDRPRWLGPIPFDYPPYLSGEAPGDYGFDIAALGKDPQDFQRYFKFKPIVVNSIPAVWNSILHKKGNLLVKAYDLNYRLHYNKM